MNLKIDKYKAKLEKLENQLEKETNEYKKKQLSSKIFILKQKNEPKKFFDSENGKTYRHY